MNHGKLLIHSLDALRLLQCTVVVTLPILRQRLDFKLSPPPHPRFPFHGLFESTLLLLLRSPHVGRTGGCPPTALPREEEEESGWSVLGEGGREGEKGNFDGWNISEIPCSAAVVVDRERSSQQVFFFSSSECSSHFSILLSNHLFSLFESGARTPWKKNQ